MFFTQPFQDTNPECKPHIPRLRMLMEELVWRERERELVCVCV